MQNMLRTELTAELGQSTCLLWGRKVDMEETRRLNMKFKIICKFIQPKSITV
jgi:hypothetical protein